MKSTSCMLSLAVISVLGCYGTSNETSTVFSIFNGDFDNIAQTAAGFQRLKARVIPVDVPALKGPAVYVESVLNGSIQILQVGEVVNVYKNKIRVKLYDFVDYTNLKPLTYNVKKLSQIKPGELRTDDDCFALFEVKNRNSLTFSYPDCKLYNNEGTHPRFTGSANCDTFNTTFPLGLGEDSLSITYILLPGPRRYPLIESSEGFVNPCGGSPVY